MYVVRVPGYPHDPVRVPEVTGTRSRVRGLDLRSNGYPMGYNFAAEVYFPTATSVSFSKSQHGIIHIIAQAGACEYSSISENLW